MEKMVITKQGAHYKPRLHSECTFFDELPVGIYKLVKPPMQEIQLEEYSDFTLPDKLYSADSIKAFSERVFNTFKEISSNLGVLLTGLKGTGKSMQLKHLAITSEMPCIIIDKPWNGAELSSFLEKMSNSCVILFDEFEKVYDCTEDQESILPLLDGTSTKKNIFVCTVNDEVNQYLLNRPSRIRYVKNYKSLSLSYIREMVSDLLDDKSKVDELMGFFSIYKEINFDVVCSFTKEVNLYPKQSIRDIAEIFNITNPYDEFMNCRTKIPTLIYPKNIKELDFDWDEFISFYNSFERFYMNRLLDGRLDKEYYLESINKIVEKYPDIFNIQERSYKIDPYTETSINDIINFYKSDGGYLCLYEDFNEKRDFNEKSSFDNSSSGVSRFQDRPVEVNVTNVGKHFTLKIDEFYDIEVF